MANSSAWFPGEPLYINKRSYVGDVAHRDACCAVVPSLTTEIEFSDRPYLLGLLVNDAYWASLVH